MTHGTIRWNAEGNVIRIQTGIEIRGMATFAGIRGVVIIALVTGIAVGSDGYMRPCEGVDGIVVKC